jgi:hypothetical protein
MNSIQVDFLGLKKLGKEFIDALPTADIDAVDAGFKCFSLAYLGCEYANSGEQLQARYLIQIIGRAMVKREIELGEA